MRRWDKLNERQLSVLQRIGGAGEPVTAASPELATTVYALRNRGLVTTPRKVTHDRTEKKRPASARIRS